MTPRIMLDPSQVKPTAPKWAREEAARVWGLHGYMTPPTLVWRRSTTRPHTSGHYQTWLHRIVVTAGHRAPRWEQREVLLHELAHALCPTEAHTDRFWRTAWLLFREARPRLPIRKVLESEGGLKAGGCRRAYRASRRNLSPPSAPVTTVQHEEVVTAVD